MHKPIYVNENRFNLYATIHKGLRRAQTQLLARIGSADGTDAEEFTPLMADTRTMIELGRRHLKHEDVHIHGVLEARSQGATHGLADDHAEHQQDFVEIETLLQRIEAAQPSRRTPLLRELYLRYSRFLADDFEHMIEEESETLALLHSLFEDHELASIEADIIGSIDPDTMFKFIRIMMPAMNFPERLGLLGGMKQAMPPQIFAVVVDASVKPSLQPQDWAKLEAALAA